MFLFRQKFSPKQAIEFAQKLLAAGSSVNWTTTQAGQGLYSATVFLTGRAEPLDFL